jgi:2-polyprenyl-3-methyl-5-hydroxy-6-metoxy-1,4-benzoquinol methylase
LNLQHLPHTKTFLPVYYLVELENICMQMSFCCILRNGVPQMADNTYSKRDLAYIRCDLCGSDESVVLFEKDGFKHVKCRKCDLIYVNPRLKDPIKQQETFYDNLAFSSGDFDEQVHHDYDGSRRKKLMKEAAQYLPYNLNGRILDIGCGFGGFLRGAAEQGWMYPEGIEVAPQAAAHASKFFPVKMKLFEETQYKEYSFDVIRMNNVIEHVSSPRALIVSAHNNLRSGGLFVINTPNYRSLSETLCREKWHYIGGDDHIYLFTLKTISQLLTKNGFNVVNIRTKGTHIAPKNHSKKPSSYRNELFNNKIKFIERMLDLFVRRTLWGHRLSIWAEKK